MIPLVYQGDGQFTAAKGFAKRCDKEFVIGEALRWEPVNERSAESHRHYFACINDSWASLPETMADEFASPEHLRKWALIKAGYCTTVKVVCASNGDAVKLLNQAAAMDTYAVVGLSDKVVTIARADSQSMKAMGKQRFQESKEAVLRVISELLGADASQAGMAA